MRESRSFRNPSRFIFFQENKVLGLLTRLTKNILKLKQKKNSILPSERKLFE